MVQSGTMRAVLCMTLVAMSTASLVNDFTTTYGFTKIMTNCFGDENYYGVLREIASAERWCQQQPIYLPEIDHPKKGYAHAVKSAIPAHGYIAVPPHAHSPVPVHYATAAHPDVHYASTPAPHGHYQAAPIHHAAHKSPYNYHQAPYPTKHHEPILTADEVYSLIEVTKAKVSNLTCTLKKLHKIDDYLKINIAPSVEHIHATPYISYSLKHDLVEGLKKCDTLTKCLPLEYSDDVVPPPAIKRILAFLKCEKKNRLISCMKEDLKRHIYDVDVSPIKHLHPYDTDDQTIERLLFVLYGAESNTFDLV